MPDKPPNFEPQLQGELQSAFDQAWSRIPDYLFEVMEPASMAELLEGTIKLLSADHHSAEALATAALLRLVGANCSRRP